MFNLVCDLGIMECTCWIIYADVVVIDVDQMLSKYAKVSQAELLRFATRSSASVWLFATIELIKRSFNQHKERQNMLQQTIARLSVVESFNVNHRCCERS